MLRQSIGGLVKLLVGAIFIFSCKKTELVTYDKEPTNHILTYSVTNANDVLYGVVDNHDNTITVSLPYYLSIDYIVPQIELEAGATLIDNEGNEIDIREDLQPVPFGTVGYSYRVKDNNNTIRTYTLVTKITPHKDPLIIGFRLIEDEHGNRIVDTTFTKQSFVNDQLVVYGNFESTSKNAKILLIDQNTNNVISDAVILNEISRDTYGNSFMRMHISAQVDSGYYAISIEHQGRKDTTLPIHLLYKKPQFNRTPATVAIGDTITLNVSNNGVNTGINRMYAKFVKQHFNFPGTAHPAGFPEELFDTPIELEIIDQNKTQVQFIFPEIPMGYYSLYISSGSGGLNATGFGFYFDFESPEWGNDNLGSSAPFTFEVTHP